MNGSVIGSATDLIAEADRAAQAKDWNRAADLLADAGDEVRILDKRSFYLSRAKRYAEALDVLGVLRGKEPNNFLWQHMTGYQFYEQQRYTEAVPWLIEAYKLNPTHLRNLYRLAQARRHQGETERATRAAGEVLRLWHQLPNAAQERDAKTFAKASYLLARLQVGNDPVGAVPLLEQAAEHDPEDYDKHYMLGKTLRRTGHATAGLASLQRAQRIKPGRNYIELELCAALIDAGEHEQAAQHLRRAERNVRGWLAWKAARLALALGRTADADRMLKQAARDRTVKVSDQYEQLKRELDAATVSPVVTPERAVTHERDQLHAPGPGETSEGAVHHVRPERGFGFLVDDADGQRCHFKLRGGEFHKGQRVTFTRVDADRGPAAVDVQPVA